MYRCRIWFASELVCCNPRLYFRRGELLLNMQLGYNLQIWIFGLVSFCFSVEQYWIFFRRANYSTYEIIFWLVESGWVKHFVWVTVIIEIFVHVFNVNIKVFSGGKWRPGVLATMMVRRRESTFRTWHFWRLPRPATQIARPMIWLKSKTVNICTDFCRIT